MKSPLFLILVIIIVLVYFNNRDIEKMQDQIAEIQINLDTVCYLLQENADEDEVMHLLTQENVNGINRNLANIGVFYNVKEKPDK